MQAENLWEPGVFRYGTGTPPLSRVHQAREPHQRAQAGPAAKREPVLACSGLVFLKMGYAGNFKLTAVIRVCYLKFQNRPFIRFYNYS